MKMSAADFADYYDRSWKLPDVRWHGRFYRWRGNFYSRISDEDIEARIVHLAKKVSVVYTAGWVAQVRNLLKALLLVPAHFVPPCDMNDGKTIHHLPFADGLWTPHGDKVDYDSRKHFVMGAMTLPREGEHSTALLKFLQDATADPESMNALLYWLGATVTSDQEMQVGLWIVGKAATGKSTFSKVMMNLFGGAAARASFSTMGNRFFPATVRDKSIVIFDDEAGLPSMSRGGALGTLRNLITHDPLRCEHKHVDEVDSVPFTGGTLITSNIIPNSFVDYVNDLTRRFLILEFYNRSGKIDTKLQSKITTEGAIRTLIEEAIGVYLKYDELPRPKASEILAEELRQNDNVYSFVQDSCDMSQPSLVTPVQEVYSAYRLWCDDTGSICVSRVEFGRRLSRRFDIQSLSINGERVYKGIGVIRAW